MPQDVLKPIGYIIILFSSLIYNEIIVLNFYGLSENTKKLVKQRVQQEVLEFNDITNLHDDDIISVNTNKIDNEEIMNLE